MPTRHLALTAALALAVTIPAATAQATYDVLLPYPPDAVFAAAVRFLRVDRNFPIQEKDPDSGYILFEMTERRQAHRGAIELIGAHDEEGRHVTRTLVTLRTLPRHYEIALADRLAAKVRADLGPPPPRPKKQEREQRGNGEGAQGEEGETAPSQKGDNDEERPAGPSDSKPPKKDQPPSRKPGELPRPPRVVP